MKFKKIVSLTALISFLVVLLNSIALYIAPHGRIAYWADWRFWGLTKDEWANQHILVGLLFLIALSIHIYYNWNLIVAYLKNKVRRVKVFTREFNVALALTVVFTLGAYMEAAPFNWVLVFSESIKSRAAEKYGEPPYGRAELSTLDAFASRMGFDLENSVEKLKREGIAVDRSDQTLLDIAKRNNTSPQRLYEAMQLDEPVSTRLPDESPHGLGRLTLNQICEQYGLDKETVLTTFNDHNVIAAQGSTIKHIADENGLTPSRIYAIIKGAVVQDEADQDLQKKPRLKKNAP